MPARPVPSGKGDARPIGLGLGRKTRDPTGPTRSGGSREPTPLPGKAAGPPVSPPRSRPSRVPAPHPRARGEQAALHPEPQARKRLTRLRTSHFVPSTSARGPRRLLSPPATRRSPVPPRPRRHLQAAPPGLSPAPPLRSPLPSPPSPAEGGSRAAAAFTSSSCGRKVHRAPGPLSGGCAAAPPRAAHKAVRGSRRRRRRPPRSGAGAGGAEEEQSPRGETRGE